MKNKIWGQLAAEFMGTFILIVLGNGIVAMVVLFDKGGFTNITLGWGIAVTMGIYTAGRISGAHLNPAVTLAFAFCRKFPWSKVIPYSLAQIAGAFVASAVIFANYYPAFMKMDPELVKTAGVFTTFPAFPKYLIFGFIDQVVGTFLLLFLTCAIVDDKNQSPGPLVPILLGLVVVVIGMSFGGMHGYAINPARDFGPRLFTVVAGFKNNGLTDGMKIFWIPIVGPLLGGVLGALTYEKGLRRLF